MLALQSMLWSSASGQETKMRAFQAGSKAFAWTKLVADLMYLCLGMVFVDSSYVSRPHGDSGTLYILQ